MMEKEVQVATSLEARPAALLVQLASKFKSNIHIKIDNKTANAKSIMGMFSLGILDGHVLTIKADGEDEAEAVAELENFLATV